MACNCGNDDYVNNCTDNCGGNCSGQYGDSPECCGEANPNCCEICNCLRFTSTNDTIDISKVGCDFDVKVSPNLLNNLLDIPGSGCITVVKETIDGKLVFTPTLNLQCVSDLIPVIPVIPDVPVYTTDNGIDMNAYNIQLGGGDAKPLLHNTLLSLGSPITPFSLTTYQKDGSGSTNVIENVIGTDGLKNVNKTTIKSGITPTDTESIVEQNSDKFTSSIQTLSNIQTDIAYLAPGYINSDISKTEFGFNYPITLDAIGHALPAANIETSSICKASSANFAISSRNIILTSASPDGIISSNGINAFNKIYSAASVSKIQNTVYPIDKVNNTMFFSEASSGSYFNEINKFNDMASGAYYAHSAVSLSDYAATIGVKLGNTTGSAYTAPINDNEATSYLQATSGQVDISAKTVVVRSQSTTNGQVSLAVDNAFLNMQAQNGYSTLSLGVYGPGPSTPKTNIALGYIAASLIDFETIDIADRAAVSFYAKTMMTGNSQVVGDPAVRVGVYVPNSLDLLVAPPIIDLTKSSYTRHTKGVTTLVANEVGVNGKFCTFDATISDAAAGFIADCAALQIKSIKGGLLLPAITTIQRLAIPSPLPGLEVFDTDMNAKMTYDNTKWTGFRYNGTKFQGYTGSAWVDLN